MTTLYQSIIDLASENINYLNSDVSDLITYIGVNTQIELLLRGKPDQLTKDPRKWETQAPMSFVRDTLSIKGHIKTLIVYPESGATPYYISNDKSVHKMNIEDIRLTDAYKSAELALGDLVISSDLAVDRINYVTNRSDKLIVSRMLYDLSKKNKLGYVSVGINIDQYQNICSNVLQYDNEGIVIKNKNGNILTTAGKVDDELIQQFSSEDLKFNNTKNGKQYFEIGETYVFRSSEKNGFELFYVVPKSNWNRNLLGVLMFPIALILAMFIVAWPLSHFSSTIVAKPLKKLYNSMGKFKEGDFSQRVEVESLDEIGELSQHFNTMVCEIKDLIDKNYVMVLHEKQSELDALQAQINPHFLYNTLDSLFWRAYNAGAEDLADDIYVLSRLFRLVLNKGANEIPLAQEIELVGNYLHIQKMRFGKKLDYEINVEPAANNVIIPKLIIQPFVENSIVHGLQTINKNGFIKIDCSLSESFLEIVVSDNGIGISSEKLLRIDSDEDNEMYSIERLGGFGINNIRQRLDLKYKNAKFRIDSLEGNGTQVHISIPILEEV